MHTFRALKLVEARHAKVVWVVDGNVDVDVGVAGEAEKRPADAAPESSGGGAVSPTPKRRRTASQPLTASSREKQAQE